MSATVCHHGRQRSICAECAPAADAAYRAARWLNDRGWDARAVVPNRDAPEVLAVHTANLTPDSVTHIEPQRDVDRLMALADKYVAASLARARASHDEEMEHCAPQARARHALLEALRAALVRPLEGES